MCEEYVIRARNKKIFIRNFQEQARYVSSHSWKLKIPWNFWETKKINFNIIVPGTMSDVEAT